MITAIPVNDDRVANHFTKASHLVPVDERGVELSRTENPALGADCSGKRKLVDLLVQQQVSRVVVRNIGERMLGKLLGHQIAVYQTDCGRRLFTELCDPDTRVLTELNKPEQGRQSFHHEAKGKNAVTLTGTQQKMRAVVGVSIITETGAVAIHEFISSRAVIFIRPVLCINQSRNVWRRQ